MQQAINKSAPTMGVAIAYFAITLYLVPKGYITEANQVEAVAMGSVIVTNLIMELKAFLGWMGAFFVRDKKE
jgi:hypothetical protein